MDDEGWLTISQAADRLGLAYRTVLHEVQQGELPAKQDKSAYGRPWHVRRTDVDAYLAAARINPGELAHLNPRLATRRR